MKVHFVIETQFFLTRDWMNLLAFKPNVLIEHCLQIYQKFMINDKENWNKSIDDIDGCDMDDADEKQMNIIENDNNINMDIKNEMNVMCNNKTGAADENLDAVIKHHIALNRIQCTNCGHLKQYLQQCMQDPILMEPAMMFMQKVSKFIQGEERNRKNRLKAKRRSMPKKPKKKNKNKSNCNNNNNNSCSDNSSRADDNVSLNDKRDRLWKYYPTTYFDFKPNTGYHMLETQLLLGEIDFKKAVEYNPFHIGLALNNVCLCLSYLLQLFISSLYTIYL